MSFRPDPAGSRGGGPATTSRTAGASWLARGSGDLGGLAGRLGADHGAGEQALPVGDRQRAEVLDGPQGDLGGLHVEHRQGAADVQVRAERDLVDQLLADGAADRVVDVDGEVDLLADVGDHGRVAEARQQARQGVAGVLDAGDGGDEAVELAVGLHRLGDDRHVDAADDLEGVLARQEGGVAAHGQDLGDALAADLRLHHQRRGVDGVVGVVGGGVHQDGRLLVRGHARGQEVDALGADVARGDQRLDAAAEGRVTAEADDLAADAVAAVDEPADALDGAEAVGQRRHLGRVGADLGDHRLEQPRLGVVAEARGGRGGGQHRQPADVAVVEVVAEVVGPLVDRLGLHRGLVLLGKEEGQREGEESEKGAELVHDGVPSIRTAQGPSVL